MDETEEQEAQINSTRPAVPQLLTWLPNLRREIWILAAGQLLLFIGQGFTLVYTSIYFVNQLGFSPTQVGLALSSGGVSGTFGRFWAGNAIDSQRFGRRGTLLLAALIASLSCFCLAFAQTFSWLIAGNLFLGLGLSLYWPATLAVTTDLTDTDNRTEAFALTRLADNLGLGLGALLAGQYIAWSGSYPVLFMSKGIAYFLFGVVIYLAIAETRVPQAQPRRLLQRWWQALRDRTLVVYLGANLFFTLYSAQLSSTLPLYLANFIPSGNTQTGFSEQWISYFFAWHALLKIVAQLPIARALKSTSHVVVLLVALGFWCSSFLLLWLTGVVSANALVFAVGAFTAIAIAEVLYSPAASALVGDLAPIDLRGIYFSLESECWAIGYIIGPTLGGWALDRPHTLGTQFWLILIIIAGIAAFLLFGLKHRLATATQAEDFQIVGDS